jgi:TonB family protein
MSTIYQAICQSSGPLLLGILIRSSALVIVGAFLLILLRSRTAEIRHFVCHGILYGILLVPLMECVVPPIRHQSPTLTRAELAVFPQQSMNLITRNTAPFVPTIIHHAQPFPWMPLVVAVYACVTCTLLLRLGLNLLFLKRLVDRSQPILDLDFQELGHQIWLESLSECRPAIRVSSDIAVPVAAGIGPVSILLPANWTIWTRETLHATLVHEMAHVRRGDPQTAFLASLAVCLFWINPLIYWLRKQLTTLAEQACDDAALLDVEPQVYAQILIEFTTVVGQKRGRLVAASTVAGHRSLIRARLEHILSVRGHVQERHPLLRAFFVAISIPTLYLAASTHFDQQQVQIGTDKAIAISITTQEQADDLESQLQLDPENLDLRGSLMVFYANKGKAAAFNQHLLWAVNHHPESPIAAMVIYRHSDPASNLPQESLAAHSAAVHDYEVIKAAWDNAVDKYPNLPDVLFHAGLFIGNNDPRRALDLFTSANALPQTDSRGQNGYLGAISLIYASAILTSRTNGDPIGRINNVAMDKSLANTLRAELDASNDPALLAEVGTTLVHVWLDDQGSSLIERSIELDPANPKWKEALESAKVEPIRRQNLHDLANSQAGHRVRIGAGVAAANLITKVEPKYPPLALQTSISGIVELAVDIDADGQVKSTQVVRGHPLLVSAAADAVRQWIYRPTMLNGNPVPVTTTVNVPFNVPR